MANNRELSQMHPLEQADRLVDFDQDVDHVSNMSDVDFIIAFEGGQLECFGEMIDGFQRLIDSGVVWQLQGAYGRTAAALIKYGYCREAGTIGTP